MIFGGIITTTLGKTATFTRGAGRERRVHHSKSLPLLSNGERLFFACGWAARGVANFAKKHLEIMDLNSAIPLTSARLSAPGADCLPSGTARPDTSAPDGIQSGDRHEY
jgi:hypothetical protein